MIQTNTKRTVRVAVLAASTLALAILLALWLTRPPAQQHSENVSSSPPDALVSAQRPAAGPNSSPELVSASPPQPASVASHPPQAADSSDVDIADLDLPPATKTMTDIVAKGLPPISNPRREVLEPTAKQTLEETIADMGNLMAFEFSSWGLYGSRHDYCEIFYWKKSTHYVKTLRVIEEGRNDPGRVATLLRNEVERSLDSYLKVGSRAYTPFLTPEVLPAFEESERCRQSILNCLYILADLGQLDSPDQLARWRRSKEFMGRSNHYPGRTHGSNTDSLDMDIWLIDRYFRQANLSDSPEAKKHFDLTKDAALDAGHTQRSVWNAAWDTQDPMLKMRGVDTAGLRTITILNLPSHINLDLKTKYEVVDNFLAHADNHKDTS